MLQVLMPMAGNGTRFNKETSKKILKPLIQLEGTFLFEKALGSLQGLPQSKIIFVIKKDDDLEFGFQDRLKELYPEAKILCLEKMTRGALETCYFAKSLLDKNSPLLILDSDLSFRASAFNDYLKSSHSEEEGGALLSFSSSDARYSYAKVEQGFVTQTAEKEVISTHALAGAYFFTKAVYFLEEAKNILQNFNERKDEKPFYVAPLFNRLIEKKLKVRFFETETYSSYGTPEELALSCKT